MSVYETITFIIQILLAVCVITSTAFLLIILRNFEDMIQQLKEISSTLITFEDHKKQCDFTNMNKIDEIIELLGQLSESLSNKQKPEPIPESLLPTPELEEQITATIKDQIATEVALASGLRSPYKDSLKDIVLRITETYPDVNVEYIVRKVVSIVEMYSA